MLRYLILLAVGALVAAMLWPHLRRHGPRHPQGGRAQRGLFDTFYLALLITLGLSFALSAGLWLFGGR
jgi:hypothetical protein